MNILEEVSQYRRKCCTDFSPVQYVCLLLNISVANPRYVVSWAYISLHISLHIVGRDGLLKGVNKMDGVGWKLLILF